jgi:hypothetical protein
VAERAVAVKVRIPKQDENGNALSLKKFSGAFYR